MSTIDRISKNLKRLRQQNNLTQQKLAIKMGLSSAGIINKWENCKAAPEFSYIDKLCDILQVDVVEFFKPVN